MKKNLTIIALGSNLGDRQQNLKQAVAWLGAEIDVVKASQIYESKALLPADAPAEWNSNFYNAVIYGYTDLSLEGLFKSCTRIEKKLDPDRVKGSAGPRKMDIDILSFNDKEFEDRKIKIPHAKMLQRNFVMWPLAEIMPNWKYPAQGPDIGRTALEIATELQLHDNPLKTKRLELTVK